MTYKNPHTFLLEISPDKSFLENWAQFKKIEKLYVPVSFGGELAADPNDTLQVLEFIDIASAAFTAEMRVGFAYTDPGLSTGSSILAELDSVTALKRFFKNKTIQGLTFNPPMASDAERLAFTAYRSILPRLIGFLSCKEDPQSIEGLISQAKVCLTQNKIYEALHLSALAREEGAELTSCFFIELEALFALGMHSEAQQILEWFQEEGNDPRLELFKLRFRSLSGYPVETLQALKKIFVREMPTALSWLERGRALIMQNMAKEAVEAFDQSLLLDKSCDALIGKGIALRAIHYGELNREGLLEALKQFEEVIAYNGYHAAEALHHAGTIHAALEQWEEAIECYRKTLFLNPSPMSKQNLALALYAIGEFDEAVAEYEYLAQFYPTFAKSLEKYFFEDDEMTFTANEDGIESGLDQRKLSKADLSEMAKDARVRLKQRRITMKNDLMDFRRFDDYVSYHAPAGMFLDSSKLHRLSDVEYKQAIFDVAIHLGELLVEMGLAQWQIEPELTPYQIGLVINHQEDQDYLPLSMFLNVARRVEAGGSENALVSLDALVGTLPGYRQAADGYSNPFMALPADEEQLEQFQSRALNAHTVLSQLGFSLTGTIADIRELEIAIASSWEEEGGLAELVQRGVLNYDLIDDIGFYFGTLFETLAEGEWYDHDDLNGVSVQSMTIKNIHPVLEIRKRFEIGPDANEMSSLLVFEPPLVCANLCIQMQENLITSREQLLQLIAENLPSIVDEDPSGTSVNRMADMITAFAGMKVE